MAADAAFADLAGESSSSSFAAGAFPLRSVAAGDDVHVDVVLRRHAQNLLDR